MKTRLLYLAGDTESSECPLFATQLKQESRMASNLNPDAQFSKFVSLLF